MLALAVVLATKLLVSWMFAAADNREHNPQLTGLQVLPATRHLFVAAGAGLLSLLECGAGRPIGDHRATPWLAPNTTSTVRDGDAVSAPCAGRGREEGWFKHRRY